ncbi:MAG: DUF4147 domain-containing protein [Acidimicrobiia bacterium]
MAFRILVESAFHGALSAVNPEQCVARILHREGSSIAVDRQSIEVKGAVRIAAIGKGAPSMARGAVAILGDLVKDGVVVTDHIESVPMPLRLLTGEHPYPSAGSLEGGAALLRIAEESGEDDLLLALISGGGSSLAEVPIEGLDVDDLVVVSREMMAAGAPIEELNCVRRHLSRLKNGGLVDAAGKTQVISLLISDVVDSPPNVISSGPTMFDGTSTEHAVAILRRRLGSRTSSRVLEVLQRVPARRPQTPDHLWKVVADGGMAAHAAAATLQAAGVPTSIASTTLRGESRSEAQRIVIESPPGTSVLAGETIVSGAVSGRGGRNQEAALAAAIAIAGRRGYHFAAFGTDGIDGPTEAAGAIVDSETVARGHALGLDAASHLDSHDSNPYLAATGDLVTTGPTGTNVGDLWFVSSP